MKKSFLITATTVALVSGAGLTAIASAQSPASTAKHIGHRHENRMDRRDDRRQRFDARLNQAVTDGTITSAQRDAFLAELRSLHPQPPKDGARPTKTERQTAHDNFKTKLEAWAKANNFPLDKIMPKL